MTHKYPELTLENVINWYWNCNPGWSTIDISREVGCCTTTVHNFMVKNGIPTRNHSKAGINRFLCQFKKEDFLKIRQSKEVREKTSESLAHFWSNPKKKRKLVNELKNRISEREKIILQTLYTKGSLFISDFNITTSEKYIKSSFYLLFQRKYVDRKKEFNLSEKRQKKYQYRYWITNKGIKIISLHLGDKFKALEKSNTIDTHEFNEDNIKKIIELRKEGYSFIEIGKRVNQKKYIVQQILKQFLDNYNDFLIKKSKYNQKIIKKVISLRKSLLKIKEISNIVNIPGSAVKKILSRNLINFPNLSVRQLKILIELNKKEGVFSSDLKKLVLAGSYKNIRLDSALHGLINRRLISKKEEFNPDVKRRNKFQNKYYISKEGGLLLTKSGLV